MSMGVHGKPAASEMLTQGKTAQHSMHGEDNCAKTPSCCGARASEVGWRCMAGPLTRTGFRQAGLDLGQQRVHRRPGAAALDVGSGSGYLTAVMGLLVGPGGHVAGVEKVEDLAARSLLSLKVPPFEMLRLLEAIDSQSVWSPRMQLMELHRRGCCYKGCLSCLQDDPCRLQLLVLGVETDRTAGGQRCPALGARDCEPPPSKAAAVTCTQSVTQVQTPWRPGT